MFIICTNFLKGKQKDLSMINANNNLKRKPSLNFTFNSFKISYGCNRNPMSYIKNVKP